MPAKGADVVNICVFVLMLSVRSRSRGWSLLLAGCHVYSVARFLVAYGQRQKQLAALSNGSSCWVLHCVW